MDFTKIAAAVVALLVAAGGAAALQATTATAPAEVEDTALRNLDVAATADNGTVTMTVTSNGTGVENVSVYADDERVGTTDANGTVTFELASDAEELDVELEKNEFEGELEFAVVDGSLVTLEEEYEYADVDEAEDDEADEEDAEEADDEADEEEADEDDDETDDDDEEDESDDDETDEDEETETDGDD